MINLIVNCSLNSEASDGKSIVAIIISCIALLLPFIRDALKSKNDKSLNIHKLQFEKEFKLYEDTWSEAAEIRNNLYELLNLNSEYVNAMSRKDSTLTEKAIADLQITVNKIQKNISQFEKKIKNNEPFYPESVFYKLRDFKNQSYLISLFSQLQGVAFSEEFHLTEVNKAIKKIDSICEAVRARIEILREN